MNHVETTRRTNALLVGTFLGALASGDAHADDKSFTFNIYSGSEDRPQRTCPFFMRDDAAPGTDDDERWRHVRTDCGVGRAVTNFRLSWHESDFVWTFSVSKSSGSIKIKLPFKALR